jgi:uncharacterized RDD family membrane protein YckC
VAPSGYESWTDAFNERAGFWRRLAGLILDAVLYTLALIVACIPGVVFVGVAVQDCVVDQEIACPPGALKITPLVVGLVLLAAAVVGIFAIYVRSMGRTGATWGRTIVGIRVVDIDTQEPIGIPRAIGRTLFENIISANILYLGHLWMLWDKNRQTWHDKVTNSTVVRT